MLRTFLCLTSLALTPFFVAGSDAAEPVDYLRDIKPLLHERCFACHGALQQQASLRLDTGELIRQGGDGGPALLPGKPDESLILERVSATEESLRMPPEGEPLTSAQIGKLRSWIANGADSPAEEQPEADPREHWAFQPVVRPPVPVVARMIWPRNPIDAFIAEQHEQHGLLPQEEAPRSLLIRRLYLDLIGLPPSAEELAEVAADVDDGWYERLVDRLLNDPRHGERWARHWMDVWRYSDWWGLGAQLRNSQQHIWHWRDWIVESLNEDLPYDEMIRLMLAADELHPEDLDRLRATGLLARNYFIFNRHQWMDETVEHVSKAFLGLTMNCSKCHDHKYDPFPQTDYYRLRAFFEPYHVRMDLLPGQADLAVDGLPRAFDALPDEPTYLFIRGDENRPDTSAAIPPGLPDVLGFRNLTIEPVPLPASAWQPERRPWVFEAHLAAAQGKVAMEESKLHTVRGKLAAARQLEAELRLAAEQRELTGKTRIAAALPLVENFATLDPQLWRMFAGDWEHASRRLEQKQDGPQRAVLRFLGDAPRDFDLTLRFTLRGGSRWRSVSIGFDVPPGDPAAIAVEEDHEQFVYVSGVEGGSKVQAAYRQAGQTVYPSDARRSLPIELNREYTFRVQVRETLINASLDGEPVLAWRSSVPRREGGLQLTTFDALAVFHEVTIAPLARDVMLREPSKTPDSSPSTAQQAALAVADAAAELRVAELALATAEADLESLRRRMAATRVGWKLADHHEPDDHLTTREREARTEAVRGERQAALAKARQTLAEVELRLLRAAADKREPIEKELNTARESVDKAEAAAAAEVAAGERFTPVIGAQWSATRFRNSGADDPALPFPSYSSGRRRALTEWITDPRHPLTARVAVNHLWTRHLGTPLVPSIFDFGRNGTPPTHPELLDWLAAELVENGWSMKHLHRLIVTSATYRLSSSVAGRAENLERDPENRSWWRRSPIRLESQVVRDSVLSLAGKLDLSTGGPPVPPSEQADSTRRSLYFFHSNNERNLFLATFDEAAVKECYRREQSIVPQQALAMSNSRLVLDAAGPIAARVAAAAPSELSHDEDGAFIRQAFVMLLGVAANDDEIAAGRQALEAWRNLPETSAEQARTHFIWVLLNHNDFVTIP